MLKQSSLCENAPQGHFVAAFGRSGAHWAFSVAAELRVEALPQPPPRNRWDAMRDGQSEGVWSIIGKPIF